MSLPLPPSPIKMNRSLEEFARVQSPRPETPEPESRQGRRNPRAAGVQLLDDDGAVSAQVRRVVTFLCLCSDAYWSSWNSLNHA